MPGLDGFDWPCPFGRKVVFLRCPPKRMVRSSSDRNDTDNRENEGSDGNPQLLIIERNESTRELMRRALRSEYDVATAPTYENGRRRAETESYDGIVVSVYHRELQEGVDMLTDLRSLDGLSTVPIIAVCPPIVEQGHEPLLEAGCDQVLKMPFTRSDLLEILAPYF